MPSSSSFFLFLSLCLFFSLPLSAQQHQFGLELYVDSTNGNDNCNGSLSCPFFSLVQARDYIRKIKQSSGLPTGGIAVNLREGYYNTTTPATSSETANNYTLYPFTLSSEDSGADGSPIVYRSYSGEHAIITGAYRVSPDQWTPSSTMNVWTLNLVDIFGNGILGTFGDLESGGLGTCANNKLELFYNGYPMVLARYPNIDDYAWQWTNIAAVDSNDPNVFYYESSLDSHAPKWENETDMWVHGYWSYDWADSYTKVTSVNTTSRLISTDPSTPPVYGYVANARYYVVNAISELDVEQEYYLDRQTGIIYFIPPSSSSPSFFSSLSFSSDVVSMSDVEYVTLSGLGIEGGRSVGVSASGGGWVTVEGCEVRNMGDTGVIIESDHSTVANNEIKYSGCRGMSMTCGDVNSLTDGGCVVFHNNIHHYARW
eukprot:CAMPEP_0201506808 /NCGR_PEP_ID=MMETSP0161_2-20130828/656_1 /ASSEMBLY_ACC=CAM_ASM_000251 /TAXON_ID=180227 /ORGANISM="Neoparamoeba aestuarina, Strain SoJaBio B1-5/56/2" /LENGTH=427 /DNA_ID=CAMNT_0047901011 /DNA_START=52 /DNA_END=1332 /DNA_ORIENTATION=-